MQQQTNTFFGLGIAPKLLDTLEQMKFTTPTPIQHQAIPIALEGKDLIGIAQTGTGKTAAFGIPMIQRLMQLHCNGLVLAPTRELALQVESVLSKLSHSFGLRTAVLIGGASMHNQIQALRKHPRIIIATPGRLIDHLQQRYADISKTGILVIDEADRMFDMGFSHQVERIIHATPKDRQTLLFSATMPSEIIRLVTRHMKLPARVEIAPQGTTTDNVTQELFVVKPEAKKQLLNKILEQYRGTVLIFTRTKIGARKVARNLRESGVSAAEIHSDLSMAQRKRSLEGFKNGEYRVLVATDIASRGIDVVGIELVINHDLPEDIENYVHRIGRTGRANMQGHAISFAHPDQRGEVKRIEQMIRTTLPISEHPGVTDQFYAIHSAPKPQNAARRPMYSFKPRGGGGGRRR